jgi:benzoyl-CoA reductase/2-hydroxyglutaryl-CoA dehydratase subunit BcrC/BadD/HgdB
MKPQKISLNAWSRQFRQLKESTIAKYKYYNNNEWGHYLQPLATFMVYGAGELKRLKFDNSLAALRLWGFVFNESERLFRAHQSNKKIIATMGDLGIVPIIVMAFPGCIPFYPECIWWTPFFNESTVLLDKASELGAPEAACFARAALAAFFKKAYFPKPDHIFASTGATCDDFSATMQAIEHLGHDITWLEVLQRRKPCHNTKHEPYIDLTDGYEYPVRYEEYLIKEYKKVWTKMTQLTNVNDLDSLQQSIKRANRLRSIVRHIRELSAKADIAPFPALELMTIEFGNLYGYADIDEWINILEHIETLIMKRVQNKEGVLTKHALPIAWISPSPDPYLLNYVEDAGLRVTHTEYVINQALVEIDENLDPFRALARSCMQASLIGSTKQRIESIKKAVQNKKVKGVIITNTLGSSHCAMETKLIARYLSSVPVLVIDIPAPFGITEQIKTRIQAFAEALSE